MLRANRKPHLPVPPFRTQLQAVAAVDIKVAAAVVDIKAVVAADGTNL
jgi:hypothetical protein